MPLNTHVCASVACRPVLGTFKRDITTFKKIFFAVPRLKPRASHMPGKCCTAELYPQPCEFKEL
jgi:hypothetical protein